MLASIELQIISKILLSDDDAEVESLLEFDETYYSIYSEQIEFIRYHEQQNQKVPDVFTFQSKFPDVELVKVDEPLGYLKRQIRLNKQRIILLETFNKLQDLDSDDVSTAWKYIGNQYDKALKLEESNPMDIVKQSEERSEQIIEFSKQQRIPTGFPEIDKLMYGGLSTVEELVVMIARTNSGKSWICTKMMETAQKNGFPVLYYSPEMQSSFLATRFDTWREHFKNSELYRGNYPEEYIEYIKQLKEQETSAFIIEDKDIPDGVSVRTLSTLVKKHGIKLLIIDGLSYMKDDEKSSREYDKYKHIATGLFNLSKQYGCAVVVAMQANRGTKESLDNQGEPFPTIYNAEGSDHPARIATQVFAVRQIFETHTLDIRLEKSRTAENTKPVLSYSWELNTGHIQHIESGDSPSAGFEAPSVQIAQGTATQDDKASEASSLLSGIGDDDSFAEVVF